MSLTISSPIKSLKEYIYPSEFSVLIISPNMGLESLHGCPSKITEIVFAENNVNSLEGLPEGIIKVNAYKNKLTNLKGLPSTVTHLRASENLLTTLDGIENTKIVSLGVSFNRLKNFKTSDNKSIPNSLESIVSVHNILTSMDGIPKCVKEKVYVSYNRLTHTFGMPITKILDISANRIKSLYGLPTPQDTKGNFIMGIEQLTASNNNLYDLYGAPLYMKVLRVDSNKLIDIKNLPERLDTFQCSKNESLFQDSEIHPIFVYLNDNQIPKYSFIDINDNTNVYSYDTEIVECNDKRFKY
jgi:hypothetical protein